MCVCVRVCVCVCVCARVRAQLLSCIQLFATPWTIARQAPLLWDSPGKNTRVVSGALLQGIFPTQGLNPRLLGLWRCRQIFYH